MMAWFPGTPDGNGANVAAIVDAAVTLSVTVTDTDGDVVSQETDIGARLQFLDDLPVAEDDTDSLAASSTDPATGNVITTGAGADDTGADVAATVTQITGAGVPSAVPGAGRTSVAGSYGTLEIAADGSYTYTRDPNTGGGDDDVFTYTLTDADGDADTATLTISIGDAPVAITGLTSEADGGDATVDEAGLSDGTDAAADTETTGGGFTISAFDGVADLSLTQGGASVTVITNDTLALGPITLTSALGSTLEITGYNAATGEVNYTYTLSDDETHPDAGRDDIFETFGISLTDRDGDVSTGDLVVQVLDDIPVITTDLTDTVTLRASDGDLGTDPAASFAGLFDIDPGADGAASTVYALGLGDAVSGLTDGATGAAIVLSLEGGEIVGRVGAGGAVAFTAAVDAGGAITLDQQRVIEHPDGNGANVASIINTAVALSVTVTDTDGDTVTQSADIGAKLEFQDDTPEIETNTAETIVLQSADDTLGTDPSTSFAGLFTVDAGADGAASTVYALGVADAASGLTDSVTGDAIVLSFDAGQVVGRVGAGGAVAFTVAVDATTGKAQGIRRIKIDEREARNLEDDFED